VDLGADWRLTKTLALRLNVFFLQTVDAIERSRMVPTMSSLGNTRDTPQYGNIEGYRMIGAEAELRHAPLEGVTVFANLSTKYGDQEVTEGDLTARKKLPWRTPIMIALGTTAGWGFAGVDWLATGLSFKAIGVREGNLKTRTPPSCRSTRTTCSTRT